MAKRTFEILRGSLVLGNDVRAVGPIVQTDDAQIIRDLEGLGEVKDALGSAQYVRELENYKGEITGRLVKPGEAKILAQPAPAVTTDPPAVLKYPNGVSEKDVQIVETALTKGGLTFETANALSDDDIKARTEGIGEGRIKLIRAVGLANEYPEFTPPAE